jgi:hypothetical protein
MGCGNSWVRGYGSYGLYSLALDEELAMTKINLPLVSETDEAIWQHDADQAILDKAVVESYEAGKAAKTPTVEAVAEIINDRSGCDCHENNKEWAESVASAILALFKGE